jgi:hypothetical protein
MGIRHVSNHESKGINRNFSLPLLLVLLLLILLLLLLLLKGPGG